jgi:hypothetical protein
VGVQDYGDRENEDIRTRYGLEFEDFPEFLIFNGGSNAEPVVYSGDVTLEGLKEWAKTETGTCTFRDMFCSMGTSR